MKGLMLKDLYTMVRQLKLFLLILVIFACMPGGISGYAIFYAAMLPTTALAYDERSKWGQMAAMMPYSKKSLVLSKYVLGYILTLCAGVISIAAQLVIGAVTKAPFGPQQLQETLLLLCVAETLLAVVLPFMFRLGVEKGRLALFILVALIVVGGLTFKDRLAGDLGGMGQSPLGAVALLAAIAIVANLISVPISKRLYDTRSAKSTSRTRAFNTH